MPLKKSRIIYGVLAICRCFRGRGRGAKVFSDITIPQPDWYEGGSIGAFSAATLSHDIGAFSNSFQPALVLADLPAEDLQEGGGGGGGGSW